MRVAVVGHVEWALFARVDRVPHAGEIVTATDAWEDVGGGGAVAAVQLTRLAGECMFLTALGNDERGHRAKDRLEALGVQVAASWHEPPQRTALVHTDANAERTITVIGERLGPAGDQQLPWPELAKMDGVYFTAGDATAARAARAGRRMVATVRAKEALTGGEVQVDLLVASANDAGEGYVPGDVSPEPLSVARTNGRHGGSITGPDGSVRRWEPAALPAPAVDAYGAGDSFAAGVTYGLALGWSPSEALDLGARCGAYCMTGRGPYAGQLDRV